MTHVKSHVAPVVLRHMFIMSRLDVYTSCSDEHLVSSLSLSLSLSLHLSNCHMTLTRPLNHWLVQANSFLVQTCLIWKCGPQPFRHDKTYILGSDVTQLKHAIHVCPRCWGSCTNQSMCSEVRIPWKISSR